MKKRLPCAIEAFFILFLQGRRPNLPIFALHDVIFQRQNPRLRVGNSDPAPPAKFAGAVVPRPSVHDRLRRRHTIADAPLRNSLRETAEYIHFPYTRRPLSRTARAVVDNVAPQHRRRNHSTHLPRRRRTAANNHGSHVPGAILHPAL